MARVLIECHDRITGADQFGEFNDLREFVARKARLAREHVRMNDSQSRR
jgi:hypothetical protein